MLNWSSEKECVDFTDRQLAVAECVRAVRNLVRFIAPDHHETLRSAANEWLKNGEGNDFWPALGPTIMVEDCLVVSRGLFFGSPKMVPVLLDELLVRQEYFFFNKREAPLIIDGGANFGLATFYFKRLCPEARIRAFEPDPRTADLYRRNMGRQDWSGTEFIEAALADRSGTMTLFASASEDTASSLIEARARDDAQPVSVKTISLADVIEEPVSLLKLDIEGAEDSALEAAFDKLHLVDHIICECHTMLKTGHSTLRKTIGVLEEAGFYYSVARSPWAERRERYQPIRGVAQPPSYTVYAMRRGVKDLPVSPRSGA